MNEMSAVPTPHKFDADTYQAMGHAGLLPERGVELIAGDIIDMASFARDRGIRHLFDSETFLAMAKAGVLKPDDRVELIAGDIVDMAPIGHEHGSGVAWFNRALVRACGDAALVWTQSTLGLNEIYMPQPDFVILKPRADFYRTGGGPTPADAFLVIEIADSSLRYDRTFKATLYARNWIPEYWVLDVTARRLIVHRQPSYSGYTAVTEHLPGETLTLTAAPDIAVLFNPPG